MFRKLNSVQVVAFIALVGFCNACTPVLAQFTFHIVAKLGDTDPRTNGVIGDRSFRDLGVPTISPDGQTIAFYGTLTLPDSQLVSAVFRSSLPSIATSSITNAGGPAPAWPTTPAPTYGGYNSNAPIALNNSSVVFSADLVPLGDFHSAIWSSTSQGISLLSAAAAAPGIYGQYFQGTTWTAGFKGQGLEVRHLAENPLPQVAIANKNGVYVVNGIPQTGGVDCASLMIPYQGLGAWFGGRRFGDAIPFVGRFTAFMASPCGTFDFNLYMGIDEPQSGGLWPIALIGMPAPETPGAIVTSLGSFCTLSGRDGDDPGTLEAAFEGTANGQWTVWAGYVQSPGAPTQFQYRKIVQEGQPVGSVYPGLVHVRPTDFYYVPGFSNALNRNHFVISDGYLAQVAVIGMVGGEGVSFANNAVLWMEQIDQQTQSRILVPVARKGDPAPGWPGATFGNPTVNAHFVPQMHVAVNSARFLVFEGFALSQTEYGYGIWMRKPNGQVLCVARPGLIVQLPAPGGGSEDWSILATELFVGANVPTSGDTIFSHGCNGLDGTGSPLSDNGKLTFWATLTRNGQQTEVIVVVDITQGSCVADVDDGTGTGTPDGGVTIDDLLYYLGLFEAGDVRADVDDGTFTGTPDGGVTIDDLLYFLIRFEAGC